MEPFHILPIHLIIWLSLSTFFLPTLSQSSELPSDDMTILHLNFPMEFIATDGMEIDIQPGIYWLSAKAEDTLQLTSTSTGVLRNLRASNITHEEPLIAPIPFLIQETGVQKPFHRILLLPNGQGLDAIGRRESVQTRGIGDLTTSYFTITQRYSGVVIQQGRVTTDEDWDEQDAVSSTGNSAQPSKSAPSYGRVTLEEGRVQLDKDARRALFRKCKTCWKSQH